MILVKYLFKTSDNKLIESVSMVDNKRHTVMYIISNWL